MKFIPLSTKSKKYAGKYFAIVSDKDYNWLKKYRWNIHISGKQKYAISLINGIPIKMHRLILGLKAGDQKLADHIDHNGLNNQRSNIRICNDSQNNQNRRAKINGTSKYLGVCFYTRSMKTPRWIANICVNGRLKHIGYFNTEEDAAMAYNEAAIKYHGKFASLNIIL